MQVPAAKELAGDDGVGSNALNASTARVATRSRLTHRRYVGHIFYAFNNQGIERTFLKGRYLNQELVDKGFAKPV
jgi:hypothetical protein